MLNTVYHAMAKAFAELCKIGKMERHSFVVKLFLEVIFERNILGLAFRVLTGGNLKV